MTIIDQYSGKGLSFTELRDNLHALKDRRLDLVVNSATLEVNSPKTLTTPTLEDAVWAGGVGLPKSDWALTPHAFRQWCAKFNVPSTYLSNLADKESDVKYQDMSIEMMKTHCHVEEKELLLRGIRDDNGDIVGRAILSPSYSIIENYDVLISVLDALAQVRDSHGIGFEASEASISDTHMRARISMPQLSMVSEALLKDYTSPFTGNTGLDNPVVFMGIEIRNSEVGAGSFSLVPSVVIQVCNNGMTLTNDIFRKVHLGSAMDKGVVSQRTMQATMDLISAQTIDKVLEIANPEFLEEKVNELLRLKAKIKTPSLVYDYLQTAFDEVQAKDIFDSFVTGGDNSAFGVAQAITAYSQTPKVHADDALKLDDSAIEHAEILAGA